MMLCLSCCARSGSAPAERPDQARLPTAATLRTNIEGFAREMLAGACKGVDGEAFHYEIPLRPHDQLADELASVFPRSSFGVYSASCDLRHASEIDINDARSNKRIAHLVCPPGQVVSYIVVVRYADDGNQLIAETGAVYAGKEHELQCVGLAGLGPSREAGSGGWTPGPFNAPTIPAAPRAIPSDVLTVVEALSWNAPGSSSIARMKYNGKEAEFLGTGGPDEHYYSAELATWPCPLVISTMLASACK